MTSFTADNHRAWHDLSEAEHVAQRDTLAAQSFRTLSLSIHGPVSAPRYAAAMVKHATVFAARQVINRSFDQFQADFESLAAEGFGPYVLSATGPADNPRYAAAFRKFGFIPLTRHHLTRARFVEMNREAHDRGDRLLWADAFGAASDPRYCAIWVPNPDRIAWNIDAVDEGGDTLQHRFLAMRATGARPTLVAGTPGGRVMEMFTDTGVGKWDAAVNMTPAEYTARRDTNAAAGRFPLCLNSRGSGADRRYAAIFAGRDDITPRTVRSSGTAAVAAIDTLMGDIIKDRNLRGLAIAVGHRTRLLYARGYTFAEAGYPDITPETRFRQASTSKTWCAAAIWRLMQQDSSFTLDTTLQSVLNLKTPSGGAPKDSRFKDVTIRYLLESTSGIPQGGIYRSKEAVDAAGSTLPPAARRSPAGSPTRT
ncbi:serine hydrolase [Sandaracinobacteroides saxicola]|uniref:Serine hydrolase n=1 Tax=Sandaracinobacteroides saxicola TaxID=2759707 RepID=A0A7G5IK55_9SPHN|nr:serine hydrolase [Sandaracinobacteroides saxicola]QMW23747.1 serine hydrolase [Sandaracinobacteroides saxicola]